MKEDEKTLAEPSTSESPTDSYWKEKLTPAPYEICRCGGIELAFTGKYWDLKIPGIYSCACCPGTVIFFK